MNNEPLFQKSNKFKHTIQVAGVTAIKNHVIVRDMHFGERKLSSGIVLLNDDEKTDGIRPRWAKVYSVGPEQTEIVPGQWVLIEHGRWTRGLKIDVNGEEIVIRRADPDCIIFVSDSEPDLDETMSDAVHMPSRTRG